MQSVVKQWVLNLPLRMQLVLLTATRGADRGEAEMLLQPLRALLFIKIDSAEPDVEDVTEGSVELFIREFGAHSVRFLLHLLHAIEVVGYRHPDHLVRGRWLAIYKRICTTMCLNFETENQLDARLGHTAEFLNTQQAKQTEEAKKVPIPPLPKVALDEEAKKKAIAERPLELDLEGAPRSTALRVTVPKSKCQCGHEHVDHYQLKPETEPDLYECCGGKCKCVKYAEARPEPLPQPAPTLSGRTNTPRTSSREVGCICGHGLGMHTVPNFSGPSQRCSSRGCHCTSYVANVST